MAIDFRIAFGKRIKGGTQELQEGCASAPDDCFRADSNQELARVFEDPARQFTEQAPLVQQGAPLNE